VNGVILSQIASAHGSDADVTHRSQDD